MGQFQPKSLSRRLWVLAIIPLSLLKLLSSLSTQWSITLVPLAYTHTVKATLPLFSVAFSRTFLGHRFSSRTLATLLPLVIGVRKLPFVSASMQCCCRFSQCCAEGW